MNKCYIFDVDGTLTDTGRAHAIFCNDMNQEGKYGLRPVNPDDPTVVSQILGTPMSQLLRNYGFPEEDIEHLDGIYSVRFKQDPKYASQPFQGIPELLKRIKELDRVLILLTSNTENNVKRDLGEDNFNLADMCIDRTWIDHHFPVPEDEEGYSQKGKAMEDILTHKFSEICHNAFTAIGDTTKDYEGAALVGCRFIGVSYGWEINPNDKRFPVAHTVQELKHLLKLD